MNQACAKLAVQGVQWNADSPAFNSKDVVCLSEVRAVLAKFGQTHRLGIARLDLLPAVAQDEILLETTDVQRREHWIRPVAKSEIVGLGIQTTVVRFDEKSWSQQCGCYPHNKGHGHSG